MNRPPPRPRVGYWDTVQDLFTRDVTEKNLREFLEYETRDTVHFFTRDVDFQSLQDRPWYRRYPLAGWRVLEAASFRLSPPRRILFLIAVPLLLLAWVRYLVQLLSTPANPTGEWQLISASLLLVLLALELRDKLSLKGDLEIAREIQFGLLPFEPYDQAGALVCASMRPANTVGGDYFDVIDLGEGRIAVVVADVAGKGIPAALLMALLQGSLRTLVTAGLRDIDLVGRLNDHLHANIPSNRLITLFYSEYEPATGTLVYVNAGHNAPYLLRRDGGSERLPATGLALGVVAQTPFVAEQRELAEGDRVFLYTDGVTEAFDPADREYGEVRLGDFLDGHRSLGHPELLEAVREDVLRFCGTARPHDDMTLLVLARGPVPAASPPAATSAPG